MILNNKYSIYPTSTFKNELENIINYIKFTLKEPNIADNLYKIIINSISSLAFLPMRNIRLYNFKNNTKNLRKLHVKEYDSIKIDTRSNFYSTYIS